MSDKPPFGIRELAERAQREGAVDMAQGVINTEPPKALVEQIKKLQPEITSKYTNKRGVPEYRRAIKVYLDSRNWTVAEGEVISTVGVTGAITAALLTDLRPGMKVLLPEPFFIGHKIMLETLGFEIVYFSVPLDEKPDRDDLKKKMDEVDAMILTTPANPTGQVVPFDVLVSLTEQAVKSDCLLLVDEVYREFIWENNLKDDNSYRDLNMEKTVVMRSFSKTLAIPGWRVGYAITSAERIEKMATHHDACYLGGSTIAQYAMAAALNEDLSEINKYINDLRELLGNNLNKLSSAFKAYGMDPLPVPGAYYLIVKHNREGDWQAMEELMTKKIVTTPVKLLYSDAEKDTGYIRAHFALSEEDCDKVVKILTHSA